MKKQYTISYDHTFDVVVEVDRAVLTDELLHEINDFWSDNDYRLRQSDGDVLLVVLKMLALRAFNMAFRSFDVVGEFNERGVEGWPKLDGSYGLKLVSVDEIELDEENLHINIVTMPDSAAQKGQTK